MFGGCSWYDDASLGAYPPGFSFAPPKVNRKPRDTVERMLLVYSCEFIDRGFITRFEHSWFVIKRTLADIQESPEVASPSWLDLLLQDGYFFEFCISAVALPMMR